MALAGMAMVYAVALCVLLRISGHRRNLYAPAKAVASLLFVATAFVVWPGVRGGEVALFSLLAAALMLCAAGDVFLGIANRNGTRVYARPFVLGAANFALAHVLFCIFFYRMVGVRWWDVLPSAVLVLVMRLLEHKGCVRLKRMRLHAYIYTVLVALMATKALQTLWLPPPAGGGAGPPVAAVGAVLFLVSDVVLLFLYFGTARHKWYRYANLTTYYVGVFLLATLAQWL